jgi:excisionase family DNA binding protein
MHADNNPLGVPGYLTIKEASKMLDLSPSRIYEYVEDGRLSCVRAAHVILIPVDEIKNFKPRLAGRPRKSPLRWRISPDNNVLLSTSIIVQIKDEQRLMQQLERIRQGNLHLFPGTIARFLIKTFPEQLEILLIWRSTVIPNETTYSKALAEFRLALTDVLDWSTAQYNEGQVLMHA